MKYFRRIKLKEIVISNREKKDLKAYCKTLGYTLDLNSQEVPTISKGERKGFLQRRNGVLHWVYQQKKEDISASIEMHKCLMKKEKPLSHGILRFLIGIIDFEYLTNYDHNLDPNRNINFNNVCND